jgi:hypothetical protein
MPPDGQPRATEALLVKIGCKNCQKSLQDFNLGLSAGLSLAGLKPSCSLFVILYDKFGV